MTIDFSNTIFIVLIFTGPIYTAAGLTLLTFRPKKINWRYGYRTKRAMGSQDAWDFAQSYSARLLTYSGLTLTAIAFISTLIPMSSQGTGIVIALVLTVSTALIPIIMTERQLKKRIKRNTHNKG